MKSQGSILNGGMRKTRNLSTSRHHDDTGGPAMPTPLRPYAPAMPILTIVIPVHNEEGNILPVFEAVSRAMAGIQGYDWRLLFIDDGSTDATLDRIRALAADPRIGYLEFSRNFGKEIATTAGLHAAARNGCDAAVLMDADLQHPPELIPVFVEKWNEGAEMVIGVRGRNKGESMIKKTGSFLFNHTMKLIGDRRYVPRSTDFRLISRPVLVEFARFTEHGRMTRGLLDWLGFRKVYVEFDAPARENGAATYSYGKLIKLAVSSFLAHSLFPLKIAGYLGVTITVIAGPILSFMMLDRYILGDPWGLNFSGPAILAMLNLTLIGIVLTCLGLVALYIGTIHKEAMNRPLYVVRSKNV